MVVKFILNRVTVSGFPAISDYELFPVLLFLTLSSTRFICLFFPSVNTFTFFFLFKFPFEFLCDNDVVSFTDRLESWSERGTITPRLILPLPKYTTHIPAEILSSKIFYYYHYYFRNANFLA